MLRLACNHQIWKLFLCIGDMENVCVSAEGKNSVRSSDCLAVDRYTICSWQRLLHFCFKSIRSLCPKPLLGCHSEWHPQCLADLQMRWFRSNHRVADSCEMSFRVNSTNSTSHTDQSTFWSGVLLILLQTGFSSSGQQASLGLTSILTQKPKLSPRYYRYDLEATLRISRKRQNLYIQSFSEPAAMQMVNAEGKTTCKYLQQAFQVLAGAFICQIGKDSGLQADFCSQHVPTQQFKHLKAYEILTCSETPWLWPIGLCSSAKRLIRQLYATKKASFLHTLSLIQIALSANNLIWWKKYFCRIGKYLA